MISATTVSIRGNCGGEFNVGKENKWYTVNRRNLVVSYLPLSLPPRRPELYVHVHRDHLEHLWEEIENKEVVNSPLVFLLTRRPLNLGKS
jgi:hypothetical protein